MEKQIQKFQENRLTKEVKRFIIDANRRIEMQFKIKFRDPFGETHTVSFCHNGKTMVESFGSPEDAEQRIETLEQQDKLDGVKNEYYILPF